MEYREDRDPLGLEHIVDRIRKSPEDDLAHPSAYRWTKLGRAFDRGERGPGNSGEFQSQSSASRLVPRDGLTQFRLRFGLDMEDSSHRWGRSSSSMTSRHGRPRFGSLS
jgi:hypothetical protein